MRSCAAVLLVATGVAAAQDPGPPVAGAARVAIDGRGHGAGVVVDPSGLVATCYHLVEVPPALGGISVQVGASADRRRARVAAVDGRRDAMILEIDSAEPLPTLELASGGPPPVGTPVLAIGHPTFAGTELPFTLTSGVVSCGDRRLGEVSYVQFDAPVHAGFSGGPLLDRAGRVLGIVAIHSARQPGIAFALPAADLRPLLDLVRAAPGEGREAEARHTVERWLDLLAGGRVLPAAAMIAPFHWEAQVPVYQELLEKVRAGAGDEALHREFAVPHSARLLAEDLGGGVDRPAIQQYLVDRAALALGAFREFEVRGAAIDGALADVAVRLDGREVTIRLVEDGGDWGVVPFLPPQPR